MFYRFSAACFLIWLPVMAAGAGAASAGAASAGPDYTAVLAERIAANPPGLSLSLSVAKPSYFIGERIPVTLTYSNTSEARCQVWTAPYSRGYRIPDISFFVDGEAGGYCDPLFTFLTIAFSGGGFGSYAELGTYSQTFDLNEWVRFDKPGTYRLYGTTGRMQYIKKPWEEYRPIEVASPTIQIVLRQRTVEEETTIIQQAHTAFTNADHQDDTQAIRALRFLATDKAIEAIIPLFAKSYTTEYEAFLAIIGARNWDCAHALMRDALADQSTVITSRFLSAMAHISLTREAYHYTESEHGKYLEWGTKLRQEKTAARTRLLEELTHVYEKKQGPARSAAIFLLYSEKQDIPDLKAHIATTFQEMTFMQRYDLLKYDWEKVKCPEFGTVLKSMTDQQPAKQLHWQSLDMYSLALGQYYDLCPEPARALIIADIKRHRPMLTRDALLAMPQSPMPELSRILLENYQKADSDKEKIAPLIRRYGSPDILPGLLHAGPSTICMDEDLFAFWLQHDRPAALVALEQAQDTERMNDFSKARMLRILGPSYGPDAERVAIHCLNAVGNETRYAAISLLTRQGSPEAISPLIAMLEKLDPKNANLDTHGHNDWSLYNAGVGGILDREEWILTNDQQKRLKPLIIDKNNKARFNRKYPSH